MAKSSAEQVRELTTDVRVLEEANETHRANASDFKAETARLRNELAALRQENAELRQELTVARQVSAERDATRARDLDKLATDLKAEREARVRLENEFTALKQQLADHIKQAETADARRWGLVVLALGAIFSLATGLIVTLVKK